MLEEIEDFESENSDEAASEQNIIWLPGHGPGESGFGSEPRFWKKRVDLTTIVNSATSSPRNVTRGPTEIKSLEAAKPLDQAQERALVKLASQGDKEALTKLIKHLLKIIRICAAHYASDRVGKEYDDLVQQGVIGALKAIEKFSCSRNNRLATYALYWIRRSILRHIYANGGCIRMPDYMCANVAKVTGVTSKLTGELGRSPENCEIATASGLTEKMVEESKAFAKLQNVSSLDTLMEESGPDSGLSEALSCEASALPDCLAELQGLREFGASILNTLPLNYRVTLDSKYGITDDKELTFEEIGKKLGVTRQRAHQIEAQAARRIRKQFGHAAKQYLDDPPGALPEPEQVTPKVELDAVRSSFYCLVLEKLTRSRGFCKKQAFLDLLELEAKDKFDPTLWSTSELGEGVPLEDWVFWTVQHLLSQNLLREAFAGEELVLTAKGWLWLETYRKFAAKVRRQ